MRMQKWTSLLLVALFLVVLMAGGAMAESAPSPEGAGAPPDGEGMGNPPDGMGAPPDGNGGGGAPGGSGGGTATSKVSVTEGDWSFDVVTQGSGDDAVKTSSITYYAGKAEAVVIVPSVLGGAPVTDIAAQAFGHHSEIRAVYVPDSVTEIEDWAFYDLNEAALISFANAGVSIAEGAFQSSGNAALYLPADTTQTEAGGKAVVTADTALLTVAIVNAEAAAIAGGTYLNVPGDYAISQDAVAAIAVSASGDASDVAYANGTVTFSGEAYQAVAQQVEIYAGFAGNVSEADLTKTLWSLTAGEADAMNQAIASDPSYGQLVSLLHYEEGYYINGNPVELSDDAKAYDVKTGEEVPMEDGRYPTTGAGYYKYIGCQDTDNDGKVDVLYYSPYTVTYT